MPKTTAFQRAQARAIKILRTGKPADQFKHIKAKQKDVAVFEARRSTPKKSSAMRAKERGR